MRHLIRSFLPALLISYMLITVAHAGETLYNGIVLPDEWPPKISELTREPMPVPYLNNRPDVVPIDVGRQLFVDDFLIEKTTLKRTFHTATYHPACPVMKPDQPWEDVPSMGKPCAMVFSDGVWYDPADKLFKMWYMGGYAKSTCYATSRDGIHWDKPSLDIVPGTNIVKQQSVRDSNTVWLDQNETNPARRYKMFTTSQRRDQKGGADLWLYYSADGIHWSIPISQNWSGHDRSTFFFNPFRNRWVYSLRDSQKRTNRRARSYLECIDLTADGLRQYTELAHPWVSADRLDPANPNLAFHNVPRELYNLDATAYESIMLGLFSIWQGDPGKPSDKRNEVLVGFSRDGFHWSRPDRHPFAGVNETDGAWNYANIQSAGGGCLVVGDQLYFYVSARGQDRATSPAVTGLAVLRRDGFASMDAGKAAGTLTTRPLTFNGRCLFVNADTNGGELRVEILDTNGNVIADFAAGNCIPIKADCTLQQVQWNNSHDLSSLTGKPVRFRFNLTNGKLYSFWVSPDESGASYGYVAAGGPGFTELRDTVGQAAYRSAADIANQSPTKKP